MAEEEKTVIHLNLAEQQGFAAMIRERDSTIQRANKLSAMIEEAAIGVVQSRGANAGPSAKWHLDAERWELVELPPQPAAPDPAGNAPGGPQEPPPEAPGGPASGDEEGRP